MKDLSTHIYFWIACCNDLWRNWFKDRINGAYDCAEIEDSLFRILVVRPLNQSMSESTVQDLIGRLRVQYIDDFQVNRQVCSVQKSGNIFCETEKVSLKKEGRYSIRSIDPMGTMMDSAPYVEVVIGERFVLEDPANLRFFYHSDY